MITGVPGSGDESNNSESDFDVPDAGSNKRNDNESQIGMRDEDIIVLRENMEHFASDLPYQDVLDRMSETFTREDEDDIKLATRTEFAKRRRLIEILMTKGPGTYVLFVKVLDDVCPHLSEALRGAVV